MTSEPSVVEVTLESDLKNLEVAEEIVRRVAGTAGFSEESEHQIEMAVHESMINAIWHGNKNDASKRVWLRFIRTGSRFVSGTRGAALVSPTYRILAPAITC